MNEELENEKEINSVEQAEEGGTENFGVQNEVSKEIASVSAYANMVKKELAKVIVGQKEYVNGLILALFTDGHVLIEGVPGIAKTLTAKLLAKTIDTNFQRIQFTPDLMPADVTGTSIFNMKKTEFEFKKGPIFSNVVLIDEINRSPAKTQSSLFEVMEEKQVTVDGTTYKMEEPFFVLATQNPIEQEGTYKLPEAQQDRFMFKLIVDYPSAEEEFMILKKFEGDIFDERINTVNPVISAKELMDCKKAISTVTIGDDLLKYIANIMDVTRNNPDLYLGASPRASLALMRGSKAVAALMGRDFVTPDDIKYISFWVLNHRIQLHPDREMEGVELKDVLKNIFESVEIPR
jgi:MoxR-like ATPase